MHVRDPSAVNIGVIGND